MSIRIRLLLLILFATLIPALVAGLQFLERRDAEIAAARLDLAATAQQVAQDLEDMARATAQLQYGLSRAHDLDTQDRAACSAFLANVLREYPQYLSILTFTPGGELLCDSLRRGRTLDVADRRYFQDALSVRNTPAVEPVFSRLTGNSVLTVAYAARRETGEPKLVLVASLNLDRIMQSRSQRLPRKNAALVLVDGKGAILTWHPDDGGKLRGTSIADTPLFRFVQERSVEAVREDIEFGGVSRMWATSTLPGFSAAGLHVLVGVSKQDLLATANRNLGQALAILLVVWLLVFAGAWMLVDDPGPRRENTAHTAELQRGKEQRRPRSGIMSAREPRVYLALALGIIALLLTSAASFFTFNESAMHSEQVNHIHEVRRELARLLSTHRDMETGGRGYAITGNPEYLRPYEQAISEADRVYRNLAELVRDNPVQAARLSSLATLHRQRIDHAARVVGLRRNVGAEAAMQLIAGGEGKRVMDSLRAAVAELDAEEVRLLRERAEEERSSMARLKWAILGSTLFALLTTVFAGIVIHREFGRRHRAEQTIREHSDLLEQHVRERTAQLRESEERLLLMTNSVRDYAIIMLDPQGHVVTWNEGARRLKGYAEAEILGAPIERFYAPEDVTDGKPQRLLALAVAEGRYKDEGWRVRKDGTRFYADVVLTAMRDEAGELVGFAKITQDITERKRAEQKIRAQLEHLSLLDQITRSTGERLDLQSILQIVLIRLEDSLPIDFGCVCLYDAAANTLRVASVGAKSQALARELTLEAHAAIDIDPNGLSRCIQGHLVYEPDIGELRFPFPARLARSGLGSLVLAPLRSESRVFGVLIVTRRAAHAFSSPECEFLRQLSEHVALAAHQAQLYTSLQQAYDDLRQTQAAAMQEERLRALGQMASGIAHDINNALSPVSLYVESLLETERDLSARARGYLETIQRAVEDVAQTVARLREFYRQREQQLELAPVQLNGLAQQVLDLTRARWRDMPQERGIAIRALTALAPDLPEVMGVESEIREALTNLVFNAVDAMPEGGTLTLRTRRVDTDSERPAVAVEVIDTGAGMDEETRRRCLEPFFTTKGERGTGLGLAMVFGMVQRHSAELEIDSAPGAGTTVRLVFAVHTAVHTESGQPVTAPQVPSGLRLLLIDDDPMLIKSLQDTLETDGHVIVTANGGEAGIAAFRAALARGERYAAVITDLGMPYVDGRQVATAVKEASRETPVIMLTGWGQRLIAEGDVPPHVDRVLAKPPKLRELRAALAQLCAPGGTRMVGQEGKQEGKKPAGEPTGLRVPA